MDVVVQFVSDYKKDLRDYNRLRVFTCMFEFIGNFVDNNETNLLRLHSCFSRIEGVFAHEDVGQQKLLYSLVTCPKARQLMGQQLYDCTLHSIRSNQVPRPYSMLCLVHLMHGNDLRKINQPVID